VLPNVRMVSFIPRRIIKSSFDWFARGQRPQRTTASCAQPCSGPEVSSDAQALAMIVVWRFAPVGGGKGPTVKRQKDVTVGLNHLSARMLGDRPHTRGPMLGEQFDS